MLLRRRKRRAQLQQLFASKARAPGLSLKRWARKHGVGHTQLYARWKRWSTAADDAEREAALGDHRGGHNRAFTPAQEELLTARVLALPTATHAAVHDIALEMHHAIQAEAGAAHAHMPLLRHRARPFSASASFVTRYKRVHRISSHRTKLGHERRAEPHAVRDSEREAEEFLHAVYGALHEFGPALVLNMDETPCKLVEQPRTALRRTGSNEAAKINTFANERLNLTFFPTISAAGNKLPLCCILRGKTERCLAKVRNGASAAVKRVQLYYSESGWSNTGIVVRYIHDVVQPYTHSRPAALILDDYASHWTPEVEAAAAAIHLRLIKVPNFKGATALLQPLDAKFNGPMKIRRVALWAARRLREPDAPDSEQAAVERTQLAYEAMTQEATMEAWRKAQIDW